MEVVGFRDNTKIFLVDLAAIELLLFGLEQVLDCLPLMVIVIFSVEVNLQATFV